MRSSLSLKRVHVGDYYIDVRQNTPETTIEHMIFIHGIGVSGRYYVPIAEKYAGLYNVHVIDMPGYGATPKPKTPLSLVQMAEVIAMYLDAIDVKRAIIIGQSMGCQTVVHFARQHPDKCSKLILIAPTINRDERHLFIQAIRLFQDTFFETLRANTIIFSDYLRMGFVRYLFTTRFMIDDQIEENIKQLNMEIAIVRGGNDPIVPKAWTDFLAERAKCATTAQISGGAHLVHFTKPTVLVNALKTFLDY